MKYNVGDKVKYDSGDWLFYGTVNAVFDSSISPCYRITVDRMEKKNCNLSITQFEFELKPDKEIEGNSLADSNRQENSEIDILKKYLGYLNSDDLPKMKKTDPQAINDKPQQITATPAASAKPEQKTDCKPEQEKPAQKTDIKSTRKAGEIWDRNLELYKKGEKSTSVINWASYIRKQYSAGTLPDDKLAKLKEVNFSFASAKKKHEKITAPPKQKTGAAWDTNCENYQKGEKSTAISSWISQNRRDYKTNCLSNERLEKLIAINFPFDTVKSKDEKWNRRLEEWKRGDRKNQYVQLWKRRSIKQYLAGKLSADKTAKLREAGILK